MQKFSNFEGFSPLPREAHLNAAYAQLNQKLRMDEFLTISTFSVMEVYLKNPSVGFHKIWQGNTLGSVFVGN